MDQDLPAAIVFNCRYNGLSIIQELGTHDVPCIAMDCDRSIGTYSRYARYVRSPDPANDQSGFVDFLHDFCASLTQRPILFPTNDEWAAAVSQNIGRLCSVALPCVANWSAVQAVIEKDRFYEFGRRQGYPTPRTWDVAELAELRPKDYPIVAKPRFRRNASDTDWTFLQKEMERLRLTVLHTADELSRFMSAEQAHVPRLVFQEFVPGASDAMYTVGVYADQDHVIRGIFTGKKVRGYPADIGDCIVGEVHGMPEEIERITATIVRELGLAGILEFEYKYHRDAGRFVLIEVNPRSWSWIGITPACGVSLPLIAYRDLAGLSANTEYRQCASLRDGEVRYYKAFPDFINCTVRYRRNFPSWRRSPLAWVKELMAVRRVVVAELNARDYPVAVVAVLAQVRGLVRGLVAAIRRSRPAECSHPAGKACSS
jgi:predicted ATP-grasp superfamily ATP-dependent carboligase